MKYSGNHSKCPYEISDKTSSQTSLFFFFQLHSAVGCQFRTDEELDLTMAMVFQKSTREGRGSKIVKGVYKGMTAVMDHGI